ncbi:phosphatidylethanolamine N-methyltransferase isoform X2 [Mycteria americana]|uniref:phosphatidylethanolamine N-methyltransferase isoform X2 n=1 Tax=Mycteria americana TaxID=33587 RepID=UPI003F58CC18
MAGGPGPGAGRRAAAGGGRPFPRECCEGLGGLEYGQVDVTAMAQLFGYVDVTDSGFIAAVLSIAFNPLFWNVLVVWMAGSKNSQPKVNLKKFPLHHAARSGKELQSWQQASPKQEQGYLCRSDARCPCGCHTVPMGAIRLWEPRLEESPLFFAAVVCYLPARAARIIAGPVLERREPSGSQAGSPGRLQHEVTPTPQHPRQHS